jgi:hypothetical protein
LFSLIFYSYFPSYLILSKIPWDNHLSYHNHLYILYYTILYNHPTACPFFTFLGVSKYVSLAPPFFFLV